MEASTSTGIEEQRVRREVLALREALEQLERERNAGVAELQGLRRAEHEELQETIRRLRAATDELHTTHAEAMQQLRRQLHSEIRELQAALAHTRSAFDEERIALQSRHQQELLAAGHIRAELEATVKQLREHADAHG
jgi:sugar-specific transcriptional regulator TrmB